MSTSKTWVGVIIAALVFSLLGCRAGDQTAVPGQSTIVIVIAEEPPSFNPVITDTGYDSLVMELVLLGLADIDAEGNVFPELAARNSRRLRTGA